MAKLTKREKGLIQSARRGEISKEKFDQLPQKLRDNIRAAIDAMPADLQDADLGNYLDSFGADAQSTAATSTPLLNAYREAVTAPTSTPFLGAATSTPPNINTATSTPFTLTEPETATSTPLNTNVAASLPTADEVAFSASNPGEWQQFRNTANPKNNPSFLGLDRQEYIGATTKGGNGRGLSPMERNALEFDKLNQDFEQTSAPPTLPFRVPTGTAAEQAPYIAANKERQKEANRVYETNRPEIKTTEELIKTRFGEQSTITPSTPAEIITETPIAGVAGQPGNPIVETSVGGAPATVTATPNGAAQRAYANYNSGGIDPLPNNDLQQMYAAVQQKAQQQRQQQIAPAQQAGNLYQRYLATQQARTIARDDPRFIRER